MSNQLISEDVARQVSEIFQEMENPVQIIYFGKGEACEYCDDTRKIAEEIAALSDKISLSVYDIQSDASLAQQYKVDKAPGLMIAGRDGDQVLDYGIRYAGVPAGHEFSSLIHDLVLVSKRVSGLSEQTRAILKGLTKPVLLQVFVTPTCPYCPRAVLLAHQMAMESPMIEAEMVEAIEFPALSDRHHVSGVPHTVINDGAGNVVGAVPEEHLLVEIQRALSNGSKR